MMALCGILISSFSYADTTPDTPHFAIARYVIAGNLKLATASLNAAVAPYTGPNADFSTIQAAVSAIQRLYKDSGYEAVRVVIPKQEVDAGVIRLEVIEAALGKVEVQGNQFFDEANVRHSLPALVPGEMPNVKSLGEELRLANESFAKQTQVTFRQGDDPGTLDADVKVVDIRPWHAGVSLDNTGTPQTGNGRLGFAFTDANLLDRDHTFSGQYVTSTENPSHVKIFGLNYGIPLYGLGETIELSTTHSNVNSGVVSTTAGSYGISGSGDNYGLHLVHLLPRTMDWDQRVNFGLDVHRYVNSVILQGGQGGSLVPNTEVHLLALAYIGFIREPAREWGINIALNHNLPGGGDASAQSLQAARQTANPNYTLLRYDFNFTQNLPNQWRLHAGLSGQYTGSSLISGEQFGIGGIYSVRGFQERILANDRGDRASIELHTPDFGRQFGSTDFKLHALAFYDTAYASRNNALSGEVAQNHLASAGLGLRGNIGRNATIRLDFARIIADDGIADSGKKTLQAGLVCLF
jgi:hemolysin activation/secretion protein